MKFYKHNKGLNYIIATVICLIILCACYFFIYLPSNERNIEEQRFRTLQNIDRNIHNKIENGVSLLNNIISGDRVKSKDYIDSFSKEKFVLSVPERNIAVGNSPLRNKLDSLVTIIANDNISEVIIDLQKRKPGKDSIIVEGFLKFSFKQFIEYLLPDAVFDEYIIFSKGKTVYESFPSGISYLKEDSTFKIQPDLNGSRIREINSGGKIYKFFLQEVNFGSDNKWVIGGLLNNSRYNKERSQLPAGIIMSLIILAFSIIVIFPCIKLYQMGSKDRLTLSDGASILLVSMILMSLLFLCLFKYNRFIRNGVSPDSKEHLASQITTAFYGETKRYYDYLKHYDSWRKKDSIENDIVNVNNKNIKSRDTVQGTKGENLRRSIDSVKQFMRLCSDAPNIKQLYWLDATGFEKYNWTEEAYNAPHGNFASRKYFKNIVNGKSYYLDGDSTKKYYLDQVVSWTTGVFTSIISIKSESGPGLSVAAAAFTMSSLDNTLLPAGYSFAVIDNSGKVLYHSLKSRNLNENVKSEFSDSATISGFINSRSKGQFITDYYSKAYSVLVTPVKNLPYSIIIFSEKSYKDVRDIEVYSFTFSMLLLLFLYIVMQLGTTFLASSRRSFFKKQLFDTSWIGPHSYRHYEYTLASIFNLFVIIILISFFKQTIFFQYLFIFLFSIILTFLFFNILLAYRYWQEGRQNNFNRKIAAAVWLLTLLIIHNFIAFYLLKNEASYHVIIAEVAFFLAGFVCFSVGKSASSALKQVLLKDNVIKIRKFFFFLHWKYTHSFTLMILTSLIITSGIPVAFFYISSYNYEQKLGIRYRQTDYASRFLERSNVNINSFDTSEHVKSEPLSRDSAWLAKRILRINENLLRDSTGVYYDGAYITGHPKVIQEKDAYKNEKLTNAKRKTFKLFAAFRLLTNDKAILTDKLSISMTEDTSVMYHPGLLDAHPDSGVYTYRQTGINNLYLQLKSYSLNYKIPEFFTVKNFATYWVLMILALFVSYFLILNIVKKIFCLNLPDISVWKGLDNKILSNNKLNKTLFIIGLPGAGKLKTVLSKIKHGSLKYNGEKLKYNSKNISNNNVLVADLINIPDKGAKIEEDQEWKEFREGVILPKYKVIIFNHFEYNIQDEFTNQAKLDLLEQVMLKTKAKIIILSTIHPINFLDSLNENAKKIASSDKKDTKKDLSGGENDAANKSGHDLERWHVLLGHFRIAIMPITKQVESPQAKSYPLLCSETDYTHFLHDMQNATVDIAKNIKDQNNENKTDELALKLQISAHYFYMYIWQSLTKEEKFLLYDLAEDNLVNSYDDYNMTMLLAKGVIINSEGSLRLFNRGFRNFILTAIGNSEAMMIKDRIRENGNWSNLRVPLIIVIITILAFLLISQQEAYSKVITYVAALSAGVPVVLKILSFFDKSSTKSAT